MTWLGDVVWCTFESEKCQEGWWWRPVQDSISERIATCLVSQRRIYETIRFTRKGCDVAGSQYCATCHLCSTQLFVPFYIFFFLSSPSLIYLKSSKKMKGEFDGVHTGKLLLCQHDVTGMTLQVFDSLWSTTSCSSSFFSLSHSVPAKYRRSHDDNILNWK